MNYSRLIYSNFSTTLTDINYILRSVWISCFGLAVIVINAFESDSGFSGSVFIEGYITFLTIAVYFTLNVFSRDNQIFNLFFRITIFLNLIGNSYFVYLAHSNSEYLFISALSLLLYSMILQIIILF